MVPKSLQGSPQGTPAPVVCEVERCTERRERHKLEEIRQGSVSKPRSPPPLRYRTRRGNAKRRRCRGRWPRMSQKALRILPVQTNVLCHDASSTHVPPHVDRLQRCQASCRRVAASSQTSSHAHHPNHNPPHAKQASIRSSSEDRRRVLRTLLPTPVHAPTHSFPLPNRRPPSKPSRRRGRPACRWPASLAVLLPSDLLIKATHQPQ